MWQIIGQQPAVDRLRRDVEKGALPHALLLTGRSGSGRTTLAVELAKTLNCVSDDAPCQRCVHCHQIAAGTHPDVSIVESASGRDSIAIQQIRDLRGGASLRPFQGRWKVYIIAGAERLTPQAADALLKTLEEPPPNVVFVLTALDMESVPPTVVSRCRLLTLRVPRESEIVDLLARELDPSEAARIARLARGNVGWAVRAARQPKLASEEEQLERALAGVFEMGMEDRLKLAESLTADRKDRANIRHVLELMLVELRRMLPVPPAGTNDGPEQPAPAAPELEQVPAMFAAVRLAMERIDQNVDPRLTLETLFLGLP
ncbi:MAG TPA: DNA polymerase III subunit delta' [Chloroflexota bacterium]|nr:DNA polymerase III subunit delta' [Chloroflexota bacterium]